MDESEKTKLLRDPEVLATACAVAYLNAAGDRQRERFMYHLTHRYFPEGRFEPKGNSFIIDPEDLKKT